MISVSADTRDLRKLRLALKVLDKESKGAVNKTLANAAAPLRQNFRAEAAATLPRRGGLAAYVAKSRFSVVKRLGGSRPTLSIRIRRPERGGAVDLVRINEGRLRHPVWGRGWTSQAVKAGMWDRVLEQAVPGIEDGLRRAVTEALEATRRAGG